MASGKEAGETTVPASPASTNEPFANLMETLLANLVGLRVKLDDNSKTTSSLLNKASSLREQIKSRRPSITESNIISSVESSPQRTRRELQTVHEAQPKEQPTPQPTTTITSTANAELQKEKEALQAQIAPLLEREKQLLQIIAYLESENQSLSESVEGCYTTLDVAMERFRAESAAARENGANLTQYKNLFANSKLENDNLRMENVALKQKMEHMLAVMQIACAEDEQSMREEDAFTSQLSIENENLRQLLQISEKMSNSVQ